MRHALANDGTRLLVEPIAGDTPKDAHNSVGRVFLAGSTILCTPRPSLTTGPTPSATRVGEARWRQLLDEAGMTDVRRAADAPFNLVLEVRPRPTRRTAPGSRRRSHRDLPPSCRYVIRRPQDWSSVKVVPQRQGSFSSTSPSLRNRSSSLASINESSRASRAVAN